MNLIANTGVQCFTFPLEVHPQDNFRMYFNEWLDIEDSQLNLEIAHYFSEDEKLWVKKHDLASLGYVKDGKVVIEHEDGKFTPAKWEDIEADFFRHKKKLIPIDEEEDVPDCFEVNIRKFNWDKFENKWLPLPFFKVRPNGQSEFGPTNWCRFKLIPVEAKPIRKYNLLLAFDTRTVFEKEDFEKEDLMETPVFANLGKNSKDYAL